MVNAKYYSRNWLIYYFHFNCLRLSSDDVLYANEERVTEYVKRRDKAEENC